MAAVADDENYADVVLICDGHFDDPNIECHLTDITRQLHMLTAGYCSTPQIVVNVNIFRNLFLCR